MRRAWLGLTLLAVVHCGAPTGPGGPPPLLTALPRALSPAELRIADAANAFAFDLLGEAARGLPPDSNAFLSPLSASMALGMALNGAGGATWEAMRSALGLAGMTEADINAGYRDLIALLGELDARTEMRTANSMWAREELSLLPAFTAVGREYFNAEIATLDFSDPGAVEAINGWVQSKTNGRIPKLLENIAAEEVLFLVNAIYFKGQWRTSFDPGDTRSGPFHAADGRDRVTPLMYQEATLRYLETGEYQAADLLYGNGAFAMTVLLPRPGSTPAELLAGLDPSAWRELADGLQEEKVRLTLPRFRLEYGRLLGEDLAALGMGIAFGDDADFSRITGPGEGLRISRVEQKTFVEVNEEGTEAAAATSVGFEKVSAPQVYVMQVDRPFVVAIRERLSGTILFLGVINLIGE